MKSDLFNSKVLIVLGLAFFIFLFDKLVLIGAVQECCTVAGRQTELFDETVNKKFYQEPIIQESKKNNIKTLLTLGSSRSLGFYKSPTPEHIEVTPFLSPIQKENLLKWEVIPSAYPGASSMISLVRLTQWLDHGYRPDRVAIEISPFSLTEKNQWFRHELLNAVSANHVFEHPEDLSWTHTRKLLGSRIFATSRYRLGKPINSKSDWDIMFETMTAKNSQKKQGIPAEGGILAGKESVTEKIIYDFVVKEITRTTLQNFTFSKDLKSYLLQTVEKCQKNKIDVIVWIPKNHPDLNLKMEQFIPAQEWKEFLNQIKRKGIPIVDMNQKGKLNCDFFVDPFHQDVRCFPEITERLIQDL
jgi:hypothetical protein